MKKRYDPFLGLRLALTGKEISPPLTSVIVNLGRDETLRRIGVFNERVTKLKCEILASRRLIPL